MFESFIYYTFDYLIRLALLSFFKKGFSSWIFNICVKFVENCDWLGYLLRHSLWIFLRKTLPLSKSENRLVRFEASLFHDYVL